MNGVTAVMHQRGEQKLGPLKQRANVECNRSEWKKNQLLRDFPTYSAGVAQIICF